MNSSCDAHDIGNKTIVVTETSNGFGLPISLTVSTELTNTLPISMSFCQKKIDQPLKEFANTTDTYAVLVKDDVTNKLTQNNRINIVSNGLINKISLLDFPIGQYILSINGQNCATAKYDNNNNCYIFDLANNTSNILNIYKEVAVAANEPKIDNRQDYLNLSRIDVAQIITPSNLKLKNMHTIKLHGYFNKNDITDPLNNIWSETTQIIKIYPDVTYRLNLNHPTESIDIKTDSDIGTIILQIDDTHYSFSSSSKMQRIKFNNPQKLYFGEQNNHLTEEINENVINLSRVNNLLLCLLDCKLAHIYQNYYDIYTYPQRERLFTC